MVDKTVTVAFGMGESIILTNDAPDIKGFVELINKNRASIDVKHIDVNSTVDSFDCESFKQVIADLVTDYLNEIELDREKYDAVISGISK